MIVKIQPCGKSFSGIANYLTHDPDKAKTAERVAWSHSHNLANEHVGAAVNEMVWTARDAELLKQEAGVRAGGRATEKPVWHCSLNWAPDERPTREHMIETADNFLNYMKYDEHQAIYVAHSDKHPHLHIMLNAVHPETGLRLDSSFDQRRAQEWALQYEREYGIYCEQRLDNPAEREHNPPRNVWMQFWINQKEFENAEKSLYRNDEYSDNNPINERNAEWKILKEIQKTERIEFFANGKMEFSQLRLSIYREIRGEFRDRWAEYYSAKKSGAEPEVLAAMKSGLVADQKALLDARRGEACADLRWRRDGLYRELLSNQAEFRAELKARQADGLDSVEFLKASRWQDRSVDDMFREAAREVTAVPEAISAARAGSGLVHYAEPDAPRDPNSERDVGDRVGAGMTRFFASLGEDLINLGSATHTPETQPVARNSFEVAAEEATKRELKHKSEEGDEEWRRRQKERSSCE
ncbi:MAG: relaxase/mobilization nuclease domain-containing protein [Xanthobacteraceae bacterium]